MIQANELRIGNLVESDLGEYLPVFRIYPNSFELGVAGNWQSAFRPKPIPLTEEWLLKFGFEKTNLSGDNEWLRLKWRTLVFEADESEEFAFVHLQIGSHEIAVIQSVHQLQNLFHALTGTELELKNENPV